MALLNNNTIVMQKNRTYHAYVPDTPVADQLPAIIVFHGGGQEVQTIAKRWGIDPPNRVPNLVENYILIFAESDPHLGERWMHFRKARYSRLPEHDLLFVNELIAEITTAGVFSVGGKKVSADPERLYAAGFSNGAGMVWQLAYSNPTMVSRFKGYATVGSALVPDKVQLYRNRHGVPDPVPLIHIHGTADTSFSAPRTLQEIEIDTTYPAFTVREMQDRNGVAPGSPSTTQLVSGTTNSTEVIAQVYSGSQAFANVTIINGGHNWPTPSTSANPPVASHFNATKAIIEFWRTHAGLP